METSLRAGLIRAIASATSGALDSIPLETSRNDRYSVRRYPPLSVATPVREGRLQGNADAPLRETADLPAPDRIVAVRARLDAP